jgi:kynureninase
MTTDPLLLYRERFPILQRTKYLVSHSLGAMPESAREALLEYANLWAARGVRAWGDTWWDGHDLRAEAAHPPAASRVLPRRYARSPSRSSSSLA